MKGLSWVAPRGPTQLLLGFSSASMQLSGGCGLGAAPSWKCPAHPSNQGGINMSQV